MKSADHFKDRQQQQSANAQLDTAGRSSKKEEGRLIHIESSDDNERKIWSRYLFRKVIGKGGFSIVITLFEKKTGRCIAAKVIDKNKIPQETLRLLQDEPTILKSISHPNIVTLVDFVESEKRIFILLEHMDGGDLSRYIKERRKVGRLFKEHEVASVLSKLLSALEHLHAKGIVHRDVKPGTFKLIVGNMLLREKDNVENVKLCDFGLAVRIKHRNSFSIRQKCGTLSYMAPELLDENIPIESRTTPAIDIFAAGVVMAIMMNGCTHPYVEKGESERLIKARILEKKFNIDRISCSSRAMDLLKRLLEADPIERISAAEALNHPWLAENSKRPAEPRRLQLRTLTTNQLAAIENQRAQLRRHMRVCLKSLLVVAACRAAQKGAGPIFLFRSKPSSMQLSTDTGRSSHRGESRLAPIAKRKADSQDLRVSNTQAQTQSFFAKKRKEVPGQSPPRIGGFRVTRPADPRLRTFSQAFDYTRKTMDVSTESDWALSADKRVGNSLAVGDSRVNFDVRRRRDNRTIFSVLKGPLRESVKARTVAPAMPRAGLQLSSTGGWAS